MTSANGYNRGTEKQSGYSKDVIAVPAIDYRSFKNIINKKGTHTQETNKNKLGLFLYKVLNSFPFNLILGEGGLLYILSGYYKAVKLVKQHNIDLVFSTFRPYSDHIIAFLLKAKFPQIFWIADFRDLHLDPTLNETIFLPFQSWCNRKILARADVVTTVSKGLAIHLQPFHNKIVVLRNGIGLASYSSMPNEMDQLPAPKHFTITYTGSMFRHLRKPDLLLVALSELFLEGFMDSTKVEIVYAGKDESVWNPLVEQYGLSSNFKALGNIRHEKAIQLQQKSHINLLLTYATPELKGNATGKLYEYLAARQPVLMLVNGCRDEELEEIFEETAAGMIAYDGLEDATRVEEFLKKLYAEWLETGTVRPAISDAALKNYRWENMMQEFFFHLNNVGRVRNPARVEAAE